MRRMVMPLGLMALCAGASAAPPEYRVVLLNPPADPEERVGTYVTRLTEFGVVLAYQNILIEDPYSVTREAFIWRDGALEMVPPPEDYFHLTLTDIDEFGRLIGQALGPDAPCSRGLMRTEGEWAPLPPIDGWRCSMPRLLAPDGRVLGTSFTPPSTLATIWNPDGSITAPVPAVPETFSSISGIDGEGVVYGIIVTKDLSDSTVWSWDGTQARPIPVPDGYSQLGYIRVNGAGERYAQATRSDGVPVVVLYSGAKVTEVMMLPSQTNVIRMNSSRAILAQQQNEYGSFDPILVRDGTAVAFADLIQPGVIDADFSDFFDINEDGWIAGVGSIRLNGLDHVLGVLLIPACPADFDLDSDADADDLADFLAAFGGGNDWADRDRNGVLDFADVLVFLEAFDTGCP